RGEIGDRVEQRFALGLGGSGDIQIDHVRRQALRGNLERRAGTRAGLEEQIEDRLAAQQGHLLDLLLGDRDERTRRVEYLQQYRRRQPFDGQQMFELALLVQLRVGDHGLQSAGGTSASVSQPVSSRRNSMVRSRSTSMLAPRYWGQIGSSRPPRSTNAAKRIE